MRNYSSFTVLFLFVVILGLAPVAASQITPSPVALLNTNATTDTGADRSPRVTSDGAGNWVSVWESDEDLPEAGPDFDIFVSRSTDNGASWTAPVPLNTNAATDLGNDFKPQIETDGAGNWVCVWESQDIHLGAGTDWDIFVARSTDNGATWTAPAFLNTNAAVDLWHDFRPQIETDGAGNWVCVWDSLANLFGAGADSDIFVTSSADNGATWTAPALLNTNAATDLGNDRFPQIETDGAGNWVCVWDSDDDFSGAGTDFDIFVSRSTDNGATWTALASLNTNATTDLGGDRNPGIVTDGAGNWVCVWQSKEDISGTGADNDIFVSRSTDNGATWTAPAVLNTNATTDSGFDAGAEIETDGAGNWVCVWYSDEDFSGAGTDWDIFVAHSTDNGATWTALAPLNTNATTDLGWDWPPGIETDGAGNWVCVWHSPEDLAGAGIDSDIFVSTFSIAVAGTDPTADSITPSTVGPTNASSVDFTVVFSEDVVNFDAANDVVIGHSGTANTGVAISGGPSTYTASVTGLSGDGSFTLAVDTTSDVQDTLGNPLSSSVTSAAVTLDNTAPTASIGSPSATSTNSGPVTYTVTYVGADSVTLANGDVTLNTGGTATGTVAVSGSGTLTRTVTISNISGDGTLGISIGSGTASDAAGNGASAAGPSATFAVDNTAPTVAIGPPSTNTTTVGPVTYTVTYAGADSVTLANVDVTLNTGGTATGTVTVSGSGTLTRTVTISSISGDGTLGISISSGTASDVVGNTASAAGPSATFSVVAIVANNSPVLDPIGDRQITASTPLNFVVSGSDPDGDAFTFSASNLPPGATFVSPNFSWTPTALDVGAHPNIVFTVTDDGTPPLSASETISITVVQPIELLCDAAAAIDGQMALFATAFGVNTDDFDLDGVPELAALTLIDFATCSSSLDALATATQNAYDINLLIFDGEPQAAAVEDFRELIAALMIIGQDTEVELKAILANSGTTLSGDYEGVTCVDAVCMPAAGPAGSLLDEYIVFDVEARATSSDSYTGSGDPDEDGFSNLEEFDNTIDNGGTFLDFALAATDPNSDGTIALSGGGGSCFIATAAYGTPMADEIDVLRVFRDRNLLNHSLGAAFVDSYYRISPPVAEVVAANPALAAAIRILLTPVVSLVHLLNGTGALLFVTMLFMMAGTLLGVRRVWNRCAVRIIRDRNANS